MRLARLLDENAGTIFLGLGVVTLLALVVSATKTPPAPPPLPVGPSGTKWQIIPRASTVTLERGRRYRACVQLSFINPVRALSTATVREKIEAIGFKDVVISDGDPPGGWPDEEDCTRYVDVTWDRPDEVRPRPSQVETAWVLV